MNSKFFLLTCALYVFTSCSTITKAQTKQLPKATHYFTELSNKKVETIFDKDGYTLNIPKSWYSYIESHGLFWLSPKELRKNKNEYYYSCKIAVTPLKIKDINTIDKLLANRIKEYKKNYKKFNYKLIEESHETYGKYYLIVYESTWNSIQYRHVNTLYFYKGKSYSINYSAFQKYYDTYLNDAMEIVASFKIIE